MKIEVKILDEAEAKADADVLFIGKTKSAEELFAEKLIMGRFL